MCVLNHYTMSKGKGGYIVTLKLSSKPFVTSTERFFHHPLIRHKPHDSMAEPTALIAVLVIDADKEQRHLNLSSSQTGNLS